ncbi:MAG: hypothetical protein Q9219_000747 [cf. Caloplaca sp. 3 TL-2023]
MRWSWTRCFSSRLPAPQRNLRPTTTINDHQETILLYRALLRQCTYLPDPAARKYMRSHIIERFHDYQPKYKGPDGRIVRQRAKKKEPSRALKEARKSLKYLQRANDGHIPQLTTVLDMTYGRVGKRWRQLQAKLRAPDPFTDAAAVTTFSQALFSQSPPPPPLPPRAKKQAPQLSDEVVALLKSQVKQASSRFERAPLRSFEPKVPELNSWGRPFPQNRKANFIRKWYATAMSRMMPPLPGPEWERLQGLATGTRPWEGPVTRRKLGSIRADTGPEDDPLLDLLLPEGLPRRLHSSTERIVEKGRHAELRTNPHQLTPRFMRGMWSRVFQKCPRLDWSFEKDRWLVTWGHMGKKAELVLDTQRAVSEDMFGGVDEGGRLLPDTILDGAETRIDSERPSGQV